MGSRSQPKPAGSPLRRAYVFVGERGYACDVVAVSAATLTVRFTKPVDLPAAVDFQVVGRPGTTRAFVRWQTGNEAGLSIEASVEAVEV